MPTFPLTDEERIKFLQWVLRNNVPLSDDYNMEGFWKANQYGDWRAHTGMNSNDGQLHFSDMFKLPNHPSFSAQSIYANEETPNWVGGLLPNGGESWSLTGKDGELNASDWPWTKRGLLDR